MSGCDCKDGACGCSAKTRGGMRMATSGDLAWFAFRRLVLSFGQGLGAVSTPIPVGRANTVNLEAVLVERDTAGVVFEEPLIVGLQVSNDGRNWSDAGSPLELYDPGNESISVDGIAAASIRVRAYLHIAEEGSAVLSVKCRLSQA